MDIDNARSTQQEVEMEPNRRSSATVAESSGGWTFLTNHSHVLICLVRDPFARLRDVAVAVGITERAVQRIVADLENGGIIERARDGRRNQYTVHGNRPLRHPVEAHTTVGDLIAVITD